MGGAVEQPEPGTGRPALDPALGHAHADADRPAVGEPAERRGLAHPQDDRRVELLPDPRHREEQRGRHLADVLGHGVDALGEVDGGAGPQRVEHREGPLGDVAERQERQLLVAFAKRGDEVRVVELEEDVAVAQHRPLGGAGGAGRVDEDGEIFGLRDLDHPVEGAGMLPVVARAQLEQRGERHDLGVAEVVEPFHVVDDDLHELGTARAHLQDLVELLLVLGEEEAGAAVVDDVLDLPRRIRRVDAVGDAADRQGAEVGVEPLRAVVGDDRHDVPGLEAERDQPEPDVPGPLAVLAPGDGTPDSEVLLPHGHLVAALPDDMTEQLGQGILPVHGEDTPIDGGPRSFHRTRGNAHALLLIDMVSNRTPSKTSPRSTDVARGRRVAARQPPRPRRPGGAPAGTVSTAAHRSRHGAIARPPNQPTPH